jgi:hypothetical protein
LTVFAVSPWRALPESFFLGFAISENPPLRLGLSRV